MTLFVTGAVIVLAVAIFWMTAPQPQKEPVRVRIQQARKHFRR